MGYSTEHFLFEGKNGKRSNSTLTYRTGTFLLANSYGRWIPVAQPFNYSEVPPLKVLSCSSSWKWKAHYGDTLHATASFMQQRSSGFKKGTYTNLRRFLRLFE